MNREKLVKYWIEASELDFRAMNNLFASSDFVWSLFLGHLVVEKLLKAIIVYQTEKSIPKIHDLIKLAKLTKLDLNDDIKDLFDIITSFNIEARYPDYKKEFYKKCDKKFAEKYIHEITRIRSWLMNHLPMLEK